MKSDLLAPDLDALCAHAPNDARRAREAVVGLGPLASWWLRADVQNLARRDEPVLDAYLKSPQLPGELGSCWILFANSRPNHLRLLRNAFLLPLRWRRDSGHSQSLPAGLLRLADRVVQQLHDEIQRSGSTWGLHLDPALGEGVLDLRRLNLACESGWAALAAGLLLTAEGIAPDPAVWASGAWDDSAGIAPVEGVKAKLRLALRYRARELFLPISAHSRAKEWLEEQGREADLCLGALEPMHTPKPALLLRNLLASLGAPPGRTAAFEQRRAFWRLQPRESARAEVFYRESLLPEIIERRRQQVKAEWSGWRPTHLVTIVSDSADLVRLSPEVLEVRHCLLLYDATKEKLKREAYQAQLVLERQDIACSTAEFADGHHIALVGRFRKHVEPFLRETPPDRTVFDMTPGKKTMTLALSRVAPPGSWMVYCRHEYSGGRPDPGSEYYERWPAEG